MPACHLITQRVYSCTPDMLPAQDSVSRQVSPFAQAGVAVAPVTGVHTSVWQMVNGDVMVQIANLSRGAYPFLKAVRFV